MTVLALAAIAVTASLGRWQLGRAAQKQALFDAVQHQLALSPWRNAEVAGLPQTQAKDKAQPALSASQMAALLHRPVELQGQWLPAQTRYLDNRQMQGKVGFFVLTPLQLAPPFDHLAVVVQRGWVPRNFMDRNALPSVTPPVGQVQLQGRLEAPPSRLYEFAADDKPPTQGAPTAAQNPLIHQNVDFAEWSRSSGLQLLALSVLQTDATPVGADLQRQWPQANAGVEKHYAYAFQWFGLSVLVVVLYVWFQIVRGFVRPAKTRSG